MGTTANFQALGSNHDVKLMNDIIFRYPSSSTATMKLCNTILVGVILICLLNAAATKKTPPPEVKPPQFDDYSQDKAEANPRPTAPAWVSEQHSELILHFSCFIKVLR